MKNYGLSQDLMMHITDGGVSYLFCWLALFCDENCDSVFARDQLCQQAIYICNRITVGWKISNTAFWLRTCTAHKNSVFVAYGYWSDREQKPISEQNVALQSYWKQAEGKIGPPTWHVASRDRCPTWGRAQRVKKKKIPQVRTGYYVTSNSD
jgi:hypothetical protein